MQTAVLCRWFGDAQRRMPPPLSPISNPPCSFQRLQTPNLKVVLSSPVLVAEGAICLLDPQEHLGRSVVSAFIGVIQPAQPVKRALQLGFGGVPRHT
eukprot:scaffold2211_cov137-Isochrysis_galbana.AAC.5